MPFTPGQIVYHVNSPSRRGVITGRSRQMGPVTAWEVNYSANDKTFIPETALRAIVVDQDTLEDRIAAGQFGHRHLPFYFGGRRGHQRLR